LSSRLPYPRPPHNRLVWHLDRPDRFGVENFTFGNVTASALAKWQKANGIDPAVGYYGPYDNERIFTEKDEVGKGFLAQVVQAWEREAFIAKSKGIRTVALRFGVVLSEKGGILSNILSNNQK
jgi:hypothetical protein